MLIKAKKLREAEDMLQDVISNAVKSLGPFERTCHDAMRVCYELLQHQGPDRRRDAVTLKVKAARLGIDVSVSVPRGEHDWQPGERPLFSQEAMFA